MRRQKNFRRGRFCDGLTRRDALRVGTASAFGMTWSLDNLLNRRAHAAEAPSADGAADEKALIIVFLKGGMSTIDAFDMKPDAPLEVRGEFQPISTNVPGTQICEHLPRVARVCDKFSMVRNFSHRNPGHSPARHYMLTGYHPTPAFNSKLSPNNEKPSHSAFIALKKGPRGSVPPYVCLPRLQGSAGSAYLGPGAAPFVISADPNSPDFSVPNLLPPLGLDPNRLDARRELLRQVGRFERTTEEAANQGARSFGVFRQKAFGLMTSAKAKEAFDITREPDARRDEYGRNTLGQSCLMARRMVEAGVRCVTVEHVDWDTHGDNFNLLKNDLLPALDRAMSTLFRDLSDRGMLEKTLVLVTGEFGRTPEISGGSAGRGHWSSVFTVLLGGGGIQGGRVVGSSDSNAAFPVGNSYGPEDLAATVHHLMGVDPDEVFYDTNGLPFPVVHNGHVIRELL